ncbi:DHA2 family efflux MFS transporter permease subunit [Nocardia sp. NBC_00508]|uniref:DHA2 family efflux MFS transporter permease subunit n=1 Tax=Nocardia sp. NBC_00508 TaxID=2975992 RepID=UPI002E811A4B|nr:DHA2 family efflux MFS transporter permease subunit [Nocardia sp. NBC_00508]WUD64919.1 DHA2 family efflux MFS transporter permease subunit [Nocardia sp. NBC_00508]
MLAPTETPSFLATRRGKLTLALLCTVAFLDFVDASIVNVALPTIQRELGMSVPTLQWVTSGYLLTYGGLLLLGGRLADLLGRRRILSAGTVVIGVSSALGGLADSSGLLIAARLAQGVGAALMLPAALSILTTSFREGSDRHTAVGIWGGAAGLASAAGVFLGGVITEGPGWRWVFYVNTPACVLVLAAIPLLIPNDQRNDIRRGFDVLGTLLATAGLMTLVFGLVKAPEYGWGDARTIGVLGVAAALLVAFVVNERATADPLVPLSIFGIRGLAAANLTHLVIAAGMLSMFFFVTLYMQTVLRYGEFEAGVAYLPVSLTIGVAAGLATKFFSRTGTRIFTVLGSLLCGLGVLLLSRISTDGSYVTDLLPGMLVMSLGAGAVFVANTTAANAGVPPEQAGLAAALLNTGQQLGGALGLAVLTAVATSHTNAQLAAGHTPIDAMNAGFGRALFVGGVIGVVAAVIGMWTVNARGDAESTAPATQPVAR